MVTPSVDCLQPTPLGLRLRAYLELCKPRVILLMLLTSVVGMLLASPGAIAMSTLVLATVGIGLTASAGAVINHLMDREFDQQMSRTKHRPIPLGVVSPLKALCFAMVLAVMGLTLLAGFVNVLTATLTFATFLGYAVIYTVFLKHATPQNIVIGGAAGAMPPVLGWTAITNHLDPNSLLLFLIIFIWTPPHFWALAIHRQKEYARAKIPMLPVTHGVAFTKLNILLYTLLLSVVSLMPFIVSMSGVIYFVGALILNGLFLRWAWRLNFREKPLDAMKTFRFSIVYLLLLFVLLLADHYFYLLR